MSILRSAGLVVLMVGAAGAQHRGGGFSPAPSARPAQASQRSNYGSLGGFGNVLYPGTGHAPGTRIGSNSGTIQQGRFRRPVIYPVIVGGYYPYGYPFGGYYDGGYGGYSLPGRPPAAVAPPAAARVINQK